MGTSIMAGKKKQKSTRGGKSGADSALEQVARDAGMEDAAAPAKGTDKDVFALSGEDSDPVFYDD